MKYLLALSLLLNVWFQFNGEIITSYIKHNAICDDLQSWSYGTTKYLDIPENIEYQCRDTEKWHKL